jgi:vancomycin resistance protein YoaR
METPVAAPELEDPGQHPPSRRPGVLAVLTLLGIVVLMIVMLAAFRLVRPGALPGLVLSGVELGGLEGPELEQAVAGVAQQRDAVEIDVVREDQRRTALAGDLGYAMDVDGTVAAVLRRGRQANPVAALADHLRVLFGNVEIQPIQTVDDRRLDAWADEVATELSLPPVEGTVRFEGEAVTRVDPQPGARVLPERVAERAQEALLLGRSTTINATTEPVTPSTTSADVDTLFDEATGAVSGPVLLSRAGQTLVFSPAEIGSILRVEQRLAADPPLQLTADPAALERVVTPEERAAFETEPVNARITLNGGVVAISDSAQGFRFDPASTATRVLELATAAGAREGELPGHIVEPSLTTEQARGLNIAEQVSTFTTNHACCQSRVTNIHRIADLVDGVLIRPGETFSLNGHVGPRTAANGFVPGGAIQDGEFVDEIGGGVSQFTTTMFNAAYFGGYDIVEHKPHSYYISRYPEGREATLNFPTVDFKFRNDSPHGILVDTSYTGTSITVSFWASRWVTVESVTGPRSRPTSADTITRRNPALPPGTQKVIQAGGTPGFDVTVTRILRFPDGREAREDFKTRYLPEPRIVEYG